MNYGDFPVGETIHIFFTTRAFATGIPGTLSAATVAVYEDITATPIQTSVAVTESLNSIAGLNAVPIVATGGNGYEVGKNYHVVIEAGTVDSVSVVGEIVAYFSIGRSTAAVDLANGTDGLGALKTLIDAIPTTAMRGTDSAATAANLATAQSDLDVITDSDGVILGAAGVDLIWDELLTGGSHNVATSAGKRLRQIDAGFEVHSGTAQAGSTGTTIKLDTGASTTDNIYRGDRIIIVGGTGIGEHGVCVSYVGSTRVATMAETWVITPINDSEFVIVPASVDIETVQHAVQTAGDLAGLIVALNDLSAANVATELETYDGPTNAEMEARTLVAASYFDPAADAVATVITNADMRGTDSAALASVATEARLAELDAGNLPAVLDAVLAMLDDSRAEPGQGAPPVNPDAMTKIDHIYKSWRNKKDNDGTTTNLYDDAGTTVDQKQATSEAAGTVTKAEWVSGP